MRSVMLVEVYGILDGICRYSNNAINVMIRYVTCKLWESHSVNTD